MAVTRAVFVDKDGTLVENVPYNADPAQVALCAGAGPALRRLADNGFRLIVISNQPGVALGHFTEEALGCVRERIDMLLAASGVRLAGFYYCPHHPDGRISRYAWRCACRKPAAGLLTRAARDHHVALDASWFVGDILDDVEAGRRAGCRTVLIDNGNETEWRRGPGREPHVVVRTLPEAAETICEGGRARRAPRSGAWIA